MRWFLLLFFVMQVSLPAWAGTFVQLILSGPEDAYEDAASAFKEALGGGVAVRAQQVDAIPAATVRELSRHGNLLVPIGLKATRYVVENTDATATILGLMVPMGSVKRLGEDRSEGRLSYAYIDQPVDRSLALIDYLFPNKTRVGVIVSGQNQEALKELERKAAQRGLVLKSTVVDRADEVGPALLRVLDNSDVYLLLPDAQVLGGPNLRTLLLASYRMRVPVVGFSAGLVKTGAVAAVYSTPGQIGLLGGNMARRWLVTGNLPTPQFAQQFVVTFNGHVARSLGIVTPPESEALKAIMAVGATP